MHDIFLPAPSFNLKDLTTFSQKVAGATSIEVERTSAWLIARWPTREKVTAALQRLLNRLSIHVKQSTACCRCSALPDRPLKPATFYPSSLARSLCFHRGSSFLRFTRQCGLSSWMHVRVHPDDGTRATNLSLNSCVLVNSSHARVAQLCVVHGTVTLTTWECHWKLFFHSFYWELFVCLPRLARSLGIRPFALATDCGP